MTKREAQRINHQESALLQLGFTVAEAEALRRISLTLRRWYELECGDSNQYGDWAIERDDDGDGKPSLVRHIYAHDGKGGARTVREPIADRERGAEKRLKAIIAARNGRCYKNNHSYLDPNDPRAGFTVSYYLQTDPRGASLYILRPGDVPDGKDVQAYYYRGICVY